MNKTLVLFAILAFAFALDDPIVTESANDGDFSCKMVMQFDNTGSWTAATDAYTTISWSETIGLYEDGTEYNTCNLKTTYNAANIEFGADKLEASCYHMTYDGENWSSETIAAEDYEWKCTNAGTPANDLNDYTCTISFDKSSTIGIASDSEFIYFTFSASTSDSAPDLTVSNAVAKEDRFFSTGKIQPMKFGDDTCGFSSIFSMATGLIAILGLSLF